MISIVTAAITCLYVPYHRNDLAYGIPLSTFFILISVTLFTFIVIHVPGSSLHEDYNHINRYILQEQYTVSELSDTDKRFITQYNRNLSVYYRHNNQVGPFVNIDTLRYPLPFIEFSNDSIIIVDPVTLLTRENKLGLTEYLYFDNK